MELSILICLYLLTAGRLHSAQLQAAYLGPHGQDGSGDYLKIETLDENQIKFCLDIVSSAGNMCNVSGTAKRTAGTNNQVYVYRSGSGADACVLELQRTSTAWVVRDKASCAQQYCGAGVGIGEVRFLLRERTKIRRCVGEDE
jgi:hypothetical protein